MFAMSAPPPVRPLVVTPPQRAMHRSGRVRLEGDQCGKIKFSGTVGRSLTGSGASVIRLDIVDGRPVLPRFARSPDDPFLHRINASARNG
jgi:hypothetical protein